MENSAHPPIVAYPELARRLVYRKYGTETELSWLESAVPALRRGQVLVRVEAVSVNPVDYKILAGEQWPFTGRTLRQPRLFGSDFAGAVVSEATPGSGLKPGDRVAGFLNPLSQGSCSQYLAVASSQCVRIPEGIDAATAAALPVAAITALRVIQSKPAAWWRGKSVYLNGGAGGIGHLLVQLLWRHGCRVTASASPSRHDGLLQLGATECVDYRQVGKPAECGSFQAVIDCHGSLVAAAHRDLFRTRGGLFIKVSLPNEAIPLAIWRLASQRLLHGQDSRIMLAIPSRKLLSQALDLVARGDLKPRIDAAYPPERARDAVAQARTGHAFGKLVIRLG